MKQFNLTEYLKNPSQKVVTREGKPVRIICTDAKCGKCPIVGLVFNEEQAEEETYNFMENGKFFPDQDWFLDLFFAPVKVKREGWVNIYRDNNTTYIGDVYPNEKDAKEYKDDDLYITTTKIEWEE